MTNDNNNDNKNDNKIIIPVKKPIIFDEEFKKPIFSSAEILAPVIDSLYESINKSVFSNTQIFSESIRELYTAIGTYQSSMIYNFTQQLRETFYNMKPFFDYIDENRDRIDNFHESLEKLKEKYDYIDDHLLDEKIDTLLEEGKIVINEDWKIEFVDEDTVKKSKSKVTFSNIIGILNIAVQLITATQTVDIQANIDNSTTNIENNYHVEHVENHYHTHVHVNESSNEYVVTNDTKLYEDASVDSDIVSNLKTGDVIHKIVIEDDWILSSILDENNKIEYTGWIKIDNVNID